MTKKQSKPISARGWALVLATIILLDDITELMDRVDFTHVSVLVADLVLIVWMLLSFYGKRSASEAK